MTRHQYGISALVSHTSFHGERRGGVAKCRLFSSQANYIHSNKISPRVMKPQPWSGLYNGL